MPFLLLHLQDTDQMTTIRKAAHLKKNIQKARQYSILRLCLPDRGQKDKRETCPPPAGHPVILKGPLLGSWFCDGVRSPKASIWFSQCLRDSANFILVFLQAWYIKDHHRPLQHKVTNVTLHKVLYLPSMKIWGKALLNNYFLYAPVLAMLVVLDGSLYQKMFPTPQWLASIQSGSYVV